MCTKTILRFGTRALLLLSMMLIAACDSEGSDWQTAKSENTDEGYARYLELHPDGKFAKNARKGRETLLYKKTRMDNTLEAFSAFLERFPDGENAEDAHKA
ncbi:MAG TPA: hypothetical protein QF604_21405, partial [Candidatus Latescibacteria bacterium]|nr:hypothetical protein [Candidatus Latescibacterota bacterium]